MSLVQQIRDTLGDSDGMTVMQLADALCTDTGSVSKACSQLKWKGEFAYSREGASVVYKLAKPDSASDSAATPGKIKKPKSKQPDDDASKALVQCKRDLDQHAPGAKLDAGKEPVRLILQAMPRALLEVSKVGAFGAKKYSENGWRAVPNGVNRYTDAMLRHVLKEGIEQRDADSGMLHAAQVAWNALARLELMLESFDSGVQRREASAGTTDQDPAE